MSGFVPSIIFGILGIVMLTLFTLFGPDERIEVYGPSVVVGFAIIVVSLVIAAAFVFKKEKYSFLGQYSTTTPVEEKPRDNASGPLPPIGGETGPPDRSRPGGRKSRWPAVE